LVLEPGEIYFEDFSVYYLSANKEGRSSTSRY